MGGRYNLRVREKLRARKWGLETLRGSGTPPKIECLTKRKNTSRVHHAD